MFRLVKVEQVNSANRNSNEVLLRLNKINLSQVKAIQCKSKTQAFLKFMHMILKNSECKSSFLKLTIMDSSNNLYTQVVGRKQMTTPINAYKYMHFIKK